MRGILLKHLLVGIPLASFLHSVLQFAYAYAPGHGDWALFPLHFVLGMLVGSVILIPAYSLQAFVSFWAAGRNVSRIGQVFLGGTLQALLVYCWDLAVGIQPSVSGNFPLAPPMVAAGFVAGGIVALVAAPAQRDGPR